MHFVGVDLPRNIGICVMIQEAGKRRVFQRRKFACDRTEKIQAFFAGLGPQVVVEAASALLRRPRAVRSTAM